MKPISIVIKEPNIFFYDITVYNWKYIYEKNICKLVKHINRLPLLSRIQNKEDTLLESHISRDNYMLTMKENNMFSIYLLSNQNKEIPHHIYKGYHSIYDYCVPISGRIIDKTICFTEVLREICIQY